MIGQSRQRGKHWRWRASKTSDMCKPVLQVLRALRDLRRRVKQSLALESQ
eukprot:CAMPEP_0204204114 /NCGR_PEP_ID=MMETSP0361-20130328/69400_1 /ASSEMBLY_ACC=CAM_ASM_000343 /TAXON_ID=268821 /ORGANISM="Scrippsiella Hangoei, Strain SHTV-5" /LENGTH=49 /DNA_ID=CAMNT_0051167165 /DNA_START=250 /DNA_END=402 /DNA_ORIENTATION=-